MKVGDTAKVYETLTKGGYYGYIMPCGHWSITTSPDSCVLLKIYPSDGYRGTLSMYDSEVRLVGKLTITKLK